MGISGINKVLKEICPDAFLEIPISKFKGKAMGIDASRWMFVAKSSAMKDVIKSMKDPLEELDQEALIESIIKQFYGFTFKLCVAGITPVWIFDGDTHPAKLATDRRKKCRASKKVSIAEERNRLLSLDPLERMACMEKFTKSLLSCFSFTRAEEDALKKEVSLMGIPMFKAPYDGEIFGSALSKKQLLIGVWTNDTDTYISGSLSTITGFSKGYFKEGPHVDVVVPAIILDELKITKEQFRDFCILHECDFNEKIPKLGPVSIRKKMETYKWDLDEFVKTEPTLPWEQVNIKECREIFEGPDVSEISIEDLTIDRTKWYSHLRTKSFEIELPPNPTLVDIV